MTIYSETATLPGAAASISERGRGPVVGVVNGTAREVVSGPHWHVEVDALPAAFGAGAAFRCELLSGHVVIEACPHWHPGKIRRCEHVEDMEQLAATRESLRRSGVSGVRS